MRVEDDIVGHFVHCIRTGERPHCDSTIGIHIAEQQMLAYQASVTNRIMLLESTFDLWWERPAGIMDLGQGYL
jgi:hypothetical protein